MSAHSRGDKLTGTVVPAVPTWSVFYDLCSDKLMAEPVLFYTVWQAVYDNGESGSEIHPVSFSGDELIEADDADNLLGLSLTGTLDRADWKEEIDAYRKRTARRAELQSAKGNQRASVPSRRRQ